MTRSSLRIEFERAERPIGGLVIKFGGSPVWLQRSQWPLSPETRRPMIFIGQVALKDSNLFPGAVAQMAYVFIADEPDKTGDPDAGENAVVLQPGAFDAPHSALSSGPTISAYDPTDGTVLSEPAEFAAMLSPRTDPDFATMAELLSWSVTEQQRYSGELMGSKVGGSPALWHESSLPFEDWRLILQLESSSAPFFVNFGFGGTGYAIANADCTRAKFFWLCG